MNTNDNKAKILLWFFYFFSRFWFYHHRQFKIIVNILVYLLQLIYKQKRNEKINIKQMDELSIHIVHYKD